MSERALRVGRNEALFRQVNEQIDDLNRTLSQLGDRTIHIVCECGELACSQVLVVPVAAYERVRSDPARFFVVPGHELLDVEDVVEEHHDYYVVRKHSGVPEHVAAATDPRS
ncbi:MAG TPA: hypothetical protein VHC45_03390 [Gaiellaceae bacterium]|jgi:hypothetical protein|nr:hypothetical protein [Gaiellaceae bacterium]